MSLKDTRLQEVPGSLQSTKFFLGEKSVVDSVDLPLTWRPGGHWNSTQVHVVADGVLQLMVHATLLETCVQVLPQITSQGPLAREDLHSRPCVFTLPSSVHWRCPIRSCLARVAAFKFTGPVQTAEKLGNLKSCVAFSLSICVAKITSR